MEEKGAQILRKRAAKGFWLRGNESRAGRGSEKERDR